MDPCLLDEHDLWLVQGDDDPPINWLFFSSVNPDVKADITGWQFELELIWPGGALTLGTLTSPGEFIIDVPGAKLTWKYPKDRSAALPAGRLTRYFLRRIVGNFRRTLVEAFIDVRVDPS